MLKQNDSSPPTVRAKVVATADGSAVTSGVAAYHLHGSTRAAVGGSAATHIANGIWEYTPTQGETNYTSYGIEFYHADAVAGGPIVEMFTDTKIVSDLNDFDDASDTVDVGKWSGTAVGAIVDTDKVPVSVQHKDSSLDLSDTEKDSVQGLTSGGVG